MLKISIILRSKVTGRRSVLIRSVLVLKRKRIKSVGFNRCRRLLAVTV